MSYGQFTALILTPTRELAVQIKSHIQRACRYTKFKVKNSSLASENYQERFHLDCCGCWWHVHTKTRTFISAKARNYRGDTRSILGIIPRGKFH